jgi:DNA-binding protein H-NS
MNLSSMTLPELNKLQSQVAREIARRNDTAKRELLKEIRKLADQKGVELGEIMKEAGLTPARKRGPARKKAGAAKKAGSKLPAKYFNPANPEQGWSGHGRRPQWVVDWLAAGKPLEDLASK